MDHILTIPPQLLTLTVKGSTKFSLEVISTTVSIAWHGRYIYIYTYILLNKSN